MADIDWSSSAMSEGDVEIEMVSPTSLTQTYGLLVDVDLSQTSVTGAYYTDTRTSGKVAYVGDGWVRGSFLRITYRVPKYDYSRTLGTYVATDESSTRKKGAWTTKLTLQSAALYTISTDIFDNEWTICAGSEARAAIRQILDKAHRPYRDLAQKSHTMGSTVVLESGKDVLSWIYAIASIADVRIDCDPQGYVTINDYVTPSTKTPVYAFDLEAERGVILDGLERTTDYLSVPGRVVVSYKYSEQVDDGSGKTKSVERQIISSTQLTSGPYSPQVRGYTIVDFHSLSELDPQTQAHADQLAKQYLDLNAHEAAEWTMTTTYLPLWEGDVVTLNVHNGDSRYSGIRTCLVKSVDISLDSKQLSLTLKDLSTD